MNTLCLKNYGVSKMETREMKEANGGWLWPIVVGVAVAEIVSDWEHFKDGLRDAF